MNAISLTAIPILLLSTAAISQSSTRVIYPKNHTNLEGGRSGGDALWAYPFHRAQMILDSWALPIADKKTILAVGYRQNGSSAWKGYKTEIEVRMGGSNFDSRNCVSNYAKNYAAPGTVVFTKKIDSPTSVGASKGPSLNFTRFSTLCPSSPALLPPRSQGRQR